MTTNTSSSKGDAISRSINDVVIMPKRNRTTFGSSMFTYNRIDPKKTTALPTCLMTLACGKKYGNIDFILEEQIQWDIR